MNTPPRTIEIFLQPGELWFGDAPTRIRTILGSCVAVVLWHPGRRIGGMCHYMLPSRGGKRGTQALDGRYGDEALAMLLTEIHARRGHPAELDAKLFGGGSMFDRHGHHGAGAAGQVPYRNIAAGRELMARHGFKVTAQHLGGYGHRQVIFDVRSGEVWMKHTPLPAAENGLDAAHSAGHPLIEGAS